jgi:hypothetical protein
VSAEPRTFSERELNRALLARQLLLERAPTPLPRALERIGGVQAQYAPAMYVGLWSRLDGFERDSLTRALERASVVQGTLMRSTIHLVSAADYWPLALATRRARREWWLRVEPGAPSAREMAAAARRLRARLAGGPLARREIEALLGRTRSRGVGLWLEMLRVPPSGTWERRRADLFGLAEDHLGPPPRMTADAALEHLVRRYLGAFGPGTRADIAGFAGVPLRPLARVLEGMELRRFRTTDGEELLDVPRATLPDPGTPAPPRFLPVWDATLLVHARRTQILPERYRSRVFSIRKPHGTPTFLIDGAVAGEWRYEDGKTALEPYEELARAERAALREEADRLAAFHA